MTKHPVYLSITLFLLASFALLSENAAFGLGEDILQDTGVSGGLIIHVGCGDGRLTATFHAGEGYIVQGLDGDPEGLTATREYFDSQGLSGIVSADCWRDGLLPYIDNLVNLIVISSPVSVDRSEILRVLAPGGTAVFLNTDGVEEKARRIVKPWPDEIDQWTHYLHGPDNNAVAQDQITGPPRRMQWVAEPRWTRHHNYLNSVSSVVTADGRLFFIVDEASPANMNLPGRWALVARNAFNGVLLWKQPIDSWAAHRNRFRSGPPQLPRLLVASDERVYVPLGLGSPISTIDTTTGETMATFEETANAEEIILTGKTLLVVKGDTVAEQALTDPAAIKTYGFPTKKTIVAVDTESEETLWSWSPSPDATLLPLTLASDGENAYVRTSEGVICLDMATGTEVWRHQNDQPTTRAKLTFGQHILLVVDGVVLFDRNGMLTALSTEGGRKLWECAAGSSFHAPLDIFVINDLVWHKVSHSADPMRIPPDQREARDLQTGELIHQDDVPLHLITQGHHFRCYRAKATERFIIMGKRGVEMADLSGSEHSRNNWVRGTCQYGIMPANGLLYAPPNSCGCFSEAALRGFWAYASDSSVASMEERRFTEDERLDKGDAYGETINIEISSTDSWPTFRQNPLRGNVAATEIPVDLEQVWSAKLGGNLMQPVIANECVVLADKDAGIVYALESEGGRVLWKHFAGGRVDSPPTIYEGKVLFGSSDGRVTCLRLKDGALAWRFLAAPSDLRTVAFDRLESPWPVSGSVLVLDGKAYACAGRSSWIDGGMYLYALDPATGEVLHKKEYQSIPPEYAEQEDVNGVHIQGHLWTDYKTYEQTDFSDSYSVSGGTSDVPVSDGTHVFLRHLMFNQELEETLAPKRQLFSTSSLLDDTEHHRTGWGIGSGDHDRLSTARYSGGYSRFHLEDQLREAPYRSDDPTGLILTHDENTVWGIARSDRRNPVGGYSLFRKNIDSSTGNKPWSIDLPVRPRAMLKSGDLLFLGVTPTDTPQDDPYEAFDGRMGGSIWIYSEKDGSKIAEYDLPSPVNWDGMAAADECCYLALKDGTVLCLGSRIE